MYLKNKSILIISPEAWGASKLSKHHYAIELGQVGNRVYFLNPPSKNLKKVKVESTPFTNVQLVTYTPIFRGINRLGSLSKYLLKLVLKIEIGIIKRQLGIDVDVVWSFDPYRFQFLGEFKAKLAIFHPVDIFNTSLDLICAETADIIFSVSPEILKKYSTLSTPSFFINHGVSKSFFTKQSVQNLELPIKCGYVGNLLSFAIHQESILQIINENPSVEFHFIGPYSSSNLGRYEASSEFVNQLLSHQNVILIGEVESEQLATAIGQFDLFLICYDSDKYGAVASNSHKILEYLSTGKTVVTSYLSTYRGISMDLFEMAKHPHDIPTLFNKTILKLDLLNSIDFQLKRKKFASENSYEEQLKKIDNIITDYFSRHLIG